MRLILEITSGPLQGRTISAEPGESVSIGRTPKAEVVVEDDFLSGLHFAIECTNGQRCILRDLQSRNGTKLNGELITEAFLKEGDLVYAGHTELRVKIEDPLKTIVSSLDNQPVARSRALPAEAPRPFSPPVPPVPSPVSPEPSAQPSERFVPPPIPPPIPAPAQAPRPPAEIAGTRNDPARAGHNAADQPIRNEQPAPPASVRSAFDSVPASLLDSYIAATPEGRLRRILREQPEPLMALVDAAHDVRVLELLRSSGEEYQSLYANDQNAALAPYLVRLPSRSELLRQMINEGWGHGWGVYLTCPLSLRDLREYFRRSLMVTMPDGMELLSRFYDPRFFRGFLEHCSPEEAEKFFGPITSYFMEDERPEILVQFTRSKHGTTKKGHLLSGDLS